MRKLAFFARLARQNIGGNRQFFLPYLFACVFSAAMFYVIRFLTWNDELLHSFGGRTVTSMMSFGSLVLGVFSVLLLFYTNSFLLKRRHRELGLYNILGMGKRHIASLLFWETLYSAAVTLLGGIGCGILLSWLAVKGLGLLMPFQINISFGIESKAVLESCALFVVIFLLILLYDLLRIIRLQPIELLRSSEKGEKEPKTRRLLTLFGLLCLGTSYYMSLSVKQPLEALSLFFLAVLLVIIGTYALFIAGSVTLLKRLKKNKNYYYTPRHFISVGDLIYRMKQNGAGLAGICILCTMVLVMLTGTTALFAGTQQAINDSYPREVQLYIGQCSDEFYEVLDEEITTLLTGAGISVENVLKLRFYPGDMNNNIGYMLKHTEPDGIFGTPRDDMRPECYYGFDVKGGQADIRQVNQALSGLDRLRENDGFRYYRTEYREPNAESIYALYGSFLFLGIFLGLLFLSATALIIYYKQLNEGYDDKERFQIMHKVGLSVQEARRAINSQIKIVFFLPLTAAVLHLAAASPMIVKLLALLEMNNALIYLLCSALTVCFFSLIYAFVYRLTAGTYYRIIRH